MNAQYAETKEGLRILKNYQRRQKMTPYELDQIDEAEFLLLEKMRERGDIRRIIKFIRES